jgi:polyisoprenoid-binding protein YceI
VKTIICTLTFLLIAFLGQSQDKEQIRSMADKKLSSITYSMRHPLHAWSGTSRDVSSVIISEGVKGNIRQVAVSARVSSFDSKNANRDSHMLEATEALKFPNITFTGITSSGTGNVLSVSGEITFHGVKHPVTFEALVQEKGSKLEVTGSFSARLSDFNITRPSLMGISVSDDIQIQFTMVY